MLQPRWLIGIRDPSALLSPAVPAAMTQSKREAH